MMENRVTHFLEKSTIMELHHDPLQGWVGQQKHQQVEEFTGDLVQNKTEAFPDDQLQGSRGSV